MRKLPTVAGAIAAAAFGTISLAGSALADGRNDWVCWMQPSGVTACGALPEPYHVRDVQWKPHVHNDRQVCRHCSVDFALTHPNIEDLGHYTDNSTMRRFHDAALYGRKYRGPYNH